MNRVLIVMVVLLSVVCVRAEDKPTLFGRLTDQQIVKLVPAVPSTNSAIQLKLDYARQLRDAKCVGASLDVLTEAVQMMYNERNTDTGEASLAACPDCHKKPKQHKVKHGNKFVWSYFCEKCGLSTDDFDNDGDAKIQWGRIVQEQKK